jgi:hypothetical protein
MKFLISSVPGTSHFKSYKVRHPEEEGKEVYFNFCKELLTVWGNPLEPKLNEVMVAYIKRNGWTAKGPIEITEKNSARNLNTFVASLNQKAKK